MQLCLRLVSLPGGLHAHITIHLFFSVEYASTHPRETQGLLADAIFSGESLLQELKSPWELILTEPVPEVVEFRSSDWAEKYFSAQSAEWNSTTSGTGSVRISSPEKIEYLFQAPMLRFAISSASGLSAPKVNFRPKISHRPG